MRTLTPQAQAVPPLRPMDVPTAQQLHMADLAEQANAMKEEAIREKRNDRQRQRYYSQKSRAKKAAKKRP